MPVRNGGLVPYANLDYAASAPCLEPVRTAVAAALPAYSSVHRGAGYASQLTTARYEQARHSVRAFAGSRPDDAVIFTRNTTDAMNLLARCLPEGTTVVVFDTEHHASLLPWPHAVRLAPPAFPGTAVRAADEALASIEGPALLVVTAASNVTGERGPSRAWRTSPTATVPGSPSTPPNSSRTDASTSPRSTSTTSPSPDTSSTPPSAPAC